MSSNAIEMLSLVRGIEHGMRLFQEAAGWDVRSAGNEFVNDSCRCMDDPSSFRNTDLYTYYAKWVTFGEHLKSIDPIISRRPLSKLRSEKSRSAMRGLMAEAYVAAHLTRPGLDFDWSQSTGLPDFEVRDVSGRCYLEATSVETDDQLSYEVCLKRLNDKIESKRAKQYAGSTCALVVEITNYLGSQKGKLNPNSGLFIDDLVPDRLGFGAIVLVSTLIRTRVDTMPFTGLEVPVEYRIVAGYNAMVAEGASSGLRAVMSKVFPSDRTYTQFFTEVPRF